MKDGQPVLFLDLHGVLVNTSEVFDSYRRLTIDHLCNDFELSEKDSALRYDRALELWETEAFGYLRNPTKKKVGKEFLNFLEHCDSLFPKFLYEGLETNNNDSFRRTRPFEYEVAKKVNALYPEVYSILERLYASGYTMYIASSSHSSHIKGLIEGNNIQPFIENYFGFDTLASTKHTMRYYKSMVKEVKADPKKCFMIGNSLHEVLKPRKLGMKTIHINRERQVPRNVRKLATRSLNDLSSLPIHLDTIPISV